MADPGFNEQQMFKTALGRTAQCLPVETLAGIAEGSLDESATRQARQHLDACAHCRSEFALLHEFLMATPGPEEAASVQYIQSELRRRPLAEPITETAAPVLQPQPLWSWVADWMRRAWHAPSWPALTVAATSLLVLLAAGLYLRNGNRLEVPSGDRPIVWRSQQFAALAPAGDVSQAPLELKWAPVQAAAKYRVSLMEVDRTEIWSVESLNTTVPVPGTLQRQMTPGRTFLWKVTAISSAGEQIAASNLQTFHILTTSH